MKVEVDGKEIRIKGDAVGDKRHIKIWCSTEDGCDSYSLSVIKDGFEHGCLPRMEMDKRNVIKCNFGDKEFI